MRTTFYTLLALSLSTLTWGAPTPGNRAVHKREDLPTKQCDIYPEGIPSYGCQPEAPYSENNQGEDITYVEHGKKYSHGMDEKDHEKDDDDYGFGELHHFLYETANVVKRGDDEKPCAKSYQYAYDNDLQMCEEYERDSLKEKYSKKDKNAKQDRMCASTYPEAYYTNFIMCKDIKKKMPDKNNGKDGGAPKTASPANPDLPVTVPEVVPKTTQAEQIEKRDDKIYPECASDYPEAYFKHLKICKDAEKPYHPTQDDHQHKECAKYYIEAYYKELPMCNDMPRHGDNQGNGQDRGDGGNAAATPAVSEGGNIFGNLVESLPPGRLNLEKVGQKVGNVSPALALVAAGSDAPPQPPLAPGQNLPGVSVKIKRDDNHKEKNCAEDYMEAHHEKLPMCDEYNKMKMLHHGDEQGKGQDGGDGDNGAAGLDLAGEMTDGLPTAPSLIGATGDPTGGLLADVTGNLLLAKRDDKKDDEMCAWSYPEAYYRHLMMCKGAEKPYHPEQDGHDHKEKKCVEDYMEAYHEILPMCDDYYRMLQHGGKQDKGQDGGDGSNDGATSSNTQGLSSILGGLTGVVKREDKTDYDTTNTKEGKKTTAYKNDKGDVSVDKITKEIKAKVLEKAKTLKEVKDGKNAKDSDKGTKDGEGKYKGKEEKKKTE